MRQGNDVGTTYRSAIYTYSPEQLEQAQASRDQYQKVMVLFSQRAAPKVTRMEPVRLLYSVTNIKNIKPS
jgi:peptide-methionine (S)-S-oxide reductase